MTLLSDLYRCRDCHEEKPLSEFPGGHRYTYCKRCNNARTRESIRRRYGNTRHYHLKQRFGIGSAEVQALIDSQGGLSAMCRVRPATQVDHDHGTGRVRAILCLHCNAGLGAFGDDPQIIARAIEYLEKSGA